MGDFKGEIEVKFRMHEKTRSWSSGYINMCPYDTPDQHQYPDMWLRLNDFFRGARSEIMAEYEDRAETANRIEQELREREEYRRLKAKYGG